MLKRISLPAGINRNSTSYASADSWYDVNNMRFRGGVPETVGGWSRLTIDVGIGEDGAFELEGIGRRCFSARTYAGHSYRYVGTNQKLYVISPSKVADITPTKQTPAGPSGSIESNAGNLVKITDTTAVAVGDFIVLTGMAGDYGNILNAVWNRDEGWQIISVGTGSYDIFVPGVTDEPAYGGAAPTIYYKVSSGLNTSSIGSGWGVGPWGGDGYTATEYDLVSGPVDTTNGSASIKVEIDGAVPSPAIVVGDQLYLKGLTGSVGGLSTDAMNDNWWRVTVENTPFFTLVPAGGVSPFSPLASSTATDGGGAAGKYYRYDLSLGEVDGASRGWGDPSEVGVAVTEELRRVYIDNYGEDILFANDGGPIYYWDISENTDPGVPDGGPTKVAKSIRDFDGSSDAPFIVDSFLVSKKDGHVVALGCNDIGGGVGDMNTLLVRWSDQNNPFDWTPSATNTSGGQMLRSGSRIIGGVSTKDEVIIFTDSAVYSMRFIGPPEIFAFTLVTDGVEILNESSAVNAANAVFFMGNDGFYVYSGSVSPLPSSVTKYVFDDLNLAMRDKIFGAVNSSFSEVSWFYPSRDSFEPNRYVTLNYDENVWSYGDYDMSALEQSTAEYITTSNVRTSWHDAAIYDFPMATYVTNWNSMMVPTDRGAGAGVTQKSGVMLHEYGTKSQDSGINAYIESGDLSLSDGDHVAFYSRVIPDIRVFDVGPNVTPNLDLTLTGKDYPGSVSSTSVTKLIVVDPTSSTDPSEFSYTPTGNDSGVRGRGRSLRMKLGSLSSGYGWRVGDVRIDLQSDGKR